MRGAGLLDWEWAAQRLESSHGHRLGSVRLDDRPHVMAVWGAYLDGAVWCSPGSESRKVANLCTNAAVAVTTDSALTSVIVEGDPTDMTSSESIEAFTAAKDATYDTFYGVGCYAANVTLRVDPVSAFGMDADDFTGLPTRWIFPGK